MSEQKTVQSRMPARLDRLSFSRWHVMVTITGCVASVLEEPASGSGPTACQVGLANSPRRS